METLQIGARVGSYEILGRLKTGGMGDVYRARDTRLDRTVAIKFLKAELNSNALNRQRFEREARSIAALTHPHICTLYDVGEHNGEQFIVMELLQGQTLATRLIAAPRGLPLDEALAIAAQVADALSFAHTHEIVHRDIKPDNIMLTPTGVKLLDFGLARLRDRDEVSNTNRTETVLTADHAVMGTLAYMSPEQIDGRADHRSDIFAFGAVLFEMLSGRRMFDGETSSAVIAAIVHQEPATLPTLRPEISPSLDRVVRRCLAKDPDKRWQSAADLADELRWIREQPASRQPPAQAKPRHGRRVALVAALGVALVAAASLAGWTVRNRGAANAMNAELPTWHRLTFNEGYVHNARFAPDGETILYSASWDGKPLQVFRTTALSPESRALDHLPPAGLLAVSRTGQLALALSCEFIGANGGCVGTLARAPQLGGAPRELAENVHSADWGLNDTLAAVVSSRLETPLGTRLADRAGLVRVSPDGQRLASSEPDGPDQWAIVVRQGQRSSVLSRGWTFVRGLTWAPDGTAVFVSGVSAVTSEGAIFRIAMDGTTRAVLRSRPFIRILDAADNNRLLIDQGDSSSRTWIHDPGTGYGRRDLTWLGNSFVDAISKDGKMVLLTVRGGSTLGGGRGLKSIDLYPIYARPTDGGPATNLGTGYGHALSDDGRWALTSTREGRNSKVVVHPLGPGSSKTLDPGGLEMNFFRDPFTVTSFAGPDRVVFNARKGDGPWQTYVQSIDGTPPTRIEHEPGQVVSPVAPDGDRFISRRLDGSLWMATLAPRPSTRLPFSLQPNQYIRQWSDDGQQVFVATHSDERWVVTRINVNTGRILPHAEINRKAGSLLPFLRISRDGRTIVYTDTRTDSALFLIEGVK
jgi:eukaryotic-like serine/threonine-protein kinase